MPSLIEHLTANMKREDALKIIFSYKGGYVVPGTVMWDKHYGSDFRAFRPFPKEGKE